MSHEIQLSNSNPPLQPILTPPQLPATTGQAEQTPLRRVHRLLRGRYALAVVLAAIGAAAGATVGIMLPKPSWKSVGMIEIRPTISTASAADITMPMYQQYVQDIVVRMHTDRVIKLAMMNPEWRKRRPFSGDVPPSEQVIEFGKNLTVKQMPLSPQNIEVDYEDSKPDAKEVVQIATTSVIGAFRDLLNSTDPDDIQSKISINEHAINQKQAEIDENRHQISALTTNAGDDDKVALDDQLHRKLDLERQLDDARGLLDQAKADKKARESGKTTTAAAYTSEQIEPLSPKMGRLLAALQLADQNVQVLQNRGRLAKDKEMEIATMSRNDRKKDVDDWTDLWNQEYIIQTRPDGSVVAISKDISSLQAKVDRLAKNLEDTKNQIVAQSHNFSQIQDLRDRNNQLLAGIQRDNQNLETLHFQQQIGGRFTSVDDGGVPTPGSDRRPVFAALGFLAGGAVPVGLLMLLGLANPRYRFSDEANGENMGMNLLGILPDLPDRLSDPEQASIAAHCVHQIRTMLQISGGIEERRVFAVTSAAPGDGKTSLTLALGLSYAACGTRTLLIDCDLVGAGLTSRMNVNAPEGVLEAIANRSLLEYVRNTDVADVAILPVGSAQTLHASTLSPAALRRLIDEARKQFDTILIDTGPILGSIEASLVCAAADAVVLTVARGQQRPLVEKSINHLVNIGAKLAGVVFNRAQSNDFDRSISGVSSLRSVASGNGHNSHDGPRYGTLGRAVQSSGRQSDSQ